MTTSFLPQGGGYKNLRVYQITEVIDDPLAMTIPYS